MKNNCADLYKNSVVAFIDILGFKSLISEGRQDEILDVMEDFSSSQKFLSRKTHSSIEMSMFSDSIFLSSEIDGENDYSIVQLVSFCGYLAGKLLSRGIFCRGAITKGSVYHRSPIAFGPALIEAYSWEASAAYFPRIIIRDDIADDYMRIERDTRGSYCRDEKFFFRVDYDGMKHVQILSISHGIEAKSSGLFSETTLAPILEFVRNELSKCTDIRVRQKLHWMENYIDEAMGTVGKVFIQKFNG